MIHSFAFVYCVLHATHTDWRDQAEDDHGPDSRDGRESVFRNRETEGRCALQGGKQADSTPWHSVQFFPAPAVIALRERMRRLHANSRLTAPAFCSRTLSSLPASLRPRSGNTLSINAIASQRGAANVISQWGQIARVPLAQDAAKNASEKT